MSPLYHIPYYPQFDKMTPEAATQAFDKLIPETRSALEELEQNLTPEWDVVMQQLHEITNPLFDAWGMVSHLLSVVNSPEWRVVQEKLQPQIVELSLRIGQSKLLYRSMLALRDSHNSTPSLTPVRERILNLAIKGAENAGVGLTPENQERFNEIQVKLAKLTTRFRNNVLDATKAFALTLTTSEEVDGLPPALLAVTAQSARQAGTETASATKGPWRITLDAAVYVPFMQHSKNRTARETLYRAYNTRASEGEQDNSPIIEQLLTLRQELAQLLNYTTYADFSLSNKSARTLSAADNLIRELELASREPEQHEASELYSFASRHGFNEPALQPWDISYWAERQREELYDYSEEELSRYFLFPRVLEGLFNLAERLFGIVITDATGEVPVWHPDVSFYRISDHDGTPLACFYFDPYSRPETKSGGAWMNTFRTRELRPDGTLILPMALMVCNQSVPVGDEPPVVRFSEVITLFHEFGHALQHMLTTLDDPQASGISGVEWDAVEIASQFMENWCYDRPTLKGLSRHAETGAELPDELFDKILAAKNYRAATAMRRQLFFGAIDLDLYARYPAPQWQDANSVKVSNAHRFISHQLPESDRFLCSFNHIFGGGYAAGYYSYKWSEVMSADCFAAFEEAGLDDPEAVATTGRRLRDTLMSLGGGTDPIEVFRLFRGRTPSIEPLLRHSGLVR